MKMVPDFWPYFLVNCKLKAVDLPGDFFISGSILGKVIEDERRTLVLPEVYKPSECSLGYQEKNNSPNLFVMEVRSNTTNNK